MASALRRSGRDHQGFTVATVEIWGKKVGAVAEDRSGRITFEYDPSFRTTGLEVSPIHLPLSRIGPQEFPDLQRSTSFAGLPGVLADALPDAFGNAIIRRYFESRGRPADAFSPVQKLLYVGSRAMGALEFFPALDGQLTTTSDEALEVARLVEEARLVIEGDTSVAVPEMMQVGASAGGARAKALILWDKKKGSVRSAFADWCPGEEQWMIKFDGVTDGRGGHNIREDTRPGPFGRIEYVYSLMARTVGIEMTDTHLLFERDFAHFMTRRFDREEGRRLHLHSLGGLDHVDYNQRGIYSYDEYFRILRAMNMKQPTLNQAYLRMVFNLAAVNQDDHVKNIAFLMRESGEWELSPAYDVTYAKGNEWTRTHQMSLGGKDDHFTRSDLIEFGAKQDIPHNGRQIIEAVEDSLSSWEQLAREVEVAEDWVKLIRSQFRRFA